MTDGTLPEAMTGLVMPENNPSTLLVTLRQAVHIYANSGQWQQLQKQAMRQDVSWETSAKHYFELYQDLLDI